MKKEILFGSKSTTEKTYIPLSLNDLSLAPLVKQVVEHIETFCDDFEHTYVKYIDNILMLDYRAYKEQQEQQEEEQEEEQQIFINFFENEKEGFTKLIESILKKFGNIINIAEITDLNKFIVGVELYYVEVNIKEKKHI